MRQTGRGCIATIKLNSLNEAGFVPLRWHCRLKVRFGAHEFTLKIRNTSRRLRYSLKLHNVQSELENGYIVYPYLGIGDYFRICYRELSEHDTPAIRRREVAAVLLYYIARPYLKKKNYYIVYEKFCRTAQDNSYFFFRYCMEELPETERRRFYYVIDRRSPDYEFVKKYESQLIQFMSLKHMIMAMGARLCISTDSTPHLYAWQTKPSFVFSRIGKKDVLFLQHGVTAMKRVDHLFGKKGSRPMKYFVATSEIEQRIIVNEFGYNILNVPITGFTRWDVLVDKSSQDDRFVLIMPTWRVWLEDVPDEDFINSDYYQKYHELLTSSRLDSLLEMNDLRIVLYLHPKFARYIENFKDSISNRVELISFGSEPLNELMMRSKMLITDYSSVCWDMLYMDKPVIFYQFDTDKYLQAHGSYIDLRHDLPSPRVTEYDALMDQLEEYVNNNFTIQEKYEAELKKFYSFRDQHNCERTYRFLADREQ